MKKYVYRFLIELANGKGISLLLAKFAASKWSRYLIPSFAKTFRIQTNELEKPYDEYESLEQFFIRRLKKGTRPIASRPDVYVSPVDGTVESFGKIEKNEWFIVKNKPYSLLELLGDEGVAKRYRQGSYIILYLSPGNYHRIHSPMTGKIIGQWTLGNRSYPVNRFGLLYGKDPLTKNYRMITEIGHEKGRFAVVKVGAMYVNSIKITHRNDRIEKGEELGYFTFGSTVILLFEKDTFTANGLVAGKNVKVGEQIGFSQGEEGMVGLSLTSEEESYHG